MYVFQILFDHSERSTFSVCTDKDRTQNNKEWCVVSSSDHPYSVCTTVMETMTENLLLSCFAWSSNYNWLSIQNILIHFYLHLMTTVVFSADRSVWFSISAIWSSKISQSLEYSYALHHVQHNVCITCIYIYCVSILLSKIFSGLGLFSSVTESFHKIEAHGLDTQGKKQVLKEHKEMLEVRMRMNIFMSWAHWHTYWVCNIHIRGYVHST